MAGWTPILEWTRMRAEYWKLQKSEQGALARGVCTPGAGMPEEKLRHGNTVHHLHQGVATLVQVVHSKYARRPDCESLYLPDGHELRSI